MRLSADQPLLRPLIDRFGFYPTWNMAMRVAGFPPDWGLTLDHVKEIQRAIENEKGKGLNHE